MKVKLLLIAFLVSCFSWGQSIFTNPITGTNPNTANPYTTGQVVAANMTASGIGRGAGIAGTSANDRYNANGWSTGLIDLTDYFEFTMTPNATFEINLVSFVYTGQVSSGTPGFAFRSSIDGYTTNIGTPSATGTTISLAAGAYQNLTTPITFRFYAFGLLMSSTTYSINDFTFNGTVTSTVACTTPATQTSSLITSNVTTTGADLSWTDGASASGTLVGLRLTANANATPVASTNYTPTLNFSTAAGANLINANNVVVAKNSAGTVTGITSLAPGTQYTATPYAYNGSGTNVCFNTTNPESLNFYTLSLEPTTPIGTLSCGASTITSIGLTFPVFTTITNATGYILLYRASAAPTGLPTDGSIYPLLSTIGDATVAAYVTNPISTTVNITGLNGGTTYYFVLIPYGSVGLIAQTVNYRTGTLITTNCNTTPAPEINVRGIIGANPTISDGDSTPSGLDNTLFTTVVVASSQAKTFRIENTGNANLTVSNITLTGLNPADFVVSGISFPTVIAGGAGIDFTITFTPSAAGTRTATLNITNTDANEANYDFALQGTGTATPIVEINVKGNGQSIPDNSIYPQGTNWTYFPVTAQLGTSPRIFTIENLGTTPLSLTGASPYIQITGAHASLFTVTVLPSNSIAGNSTTTFTITFAPLTGGAKNATITIFNNDTDESIYNFNIAGTCIGNNNIYVTGNGSDVVKGAVTTSTTNLTNFGLIAVPSGVKQNTFVITNLSGATRYLNNVSVSGADAALFTVVAQPNNGAFGNGNTTSFTVSFTPTSAGVKNATVSFNVYTNSARTTPDLLDPVYTFAVSGEGIVYTSCTNNAVQTIAIQDFEAVPATPTWAYTPVLTDAVTAIAGGTFNNGSGAVNAFIGARSYQFKGATTGTTGSAVLTMNSVNVSQFNNIDFSMRVAAFRVSGTTQGLDVNDLVQVETSIDGGVNWSVESVLRGYTNSRWGFAATGNFNAYYTGNNSGSTIDTRLGNAELLGAAGISTYYVKNLPQSTALLIRITLNVDRTDEMWALDNIKIEGQTPQSTNWNGLNWSAGFPTPSTKAIFNADYTTLVDPAHGIGSVEACELVIRSSATVTIDSNFYFEIQSDIKNSGALTIANNGSLVQVNDAAVNTGAITYQRTSTPYERYDYTYWSSPVDTATSLATLFSGWRTDYAFEFNTANFYDVKTINSAGTVTAVASDSFDDIAPFAWQRYTGAMTKGKGYAIMAPTAVTFSPSAPGVAVALTGIPNNGVITLPLVETANLDAGYVGVNNPNDDYNLVGNPYPSALFANKFIIDNGTNTSGTLYFWTHVLNIAASNPGPSNLNFISDDYALYNMSGGTRASLTTPASSTPTGYIGSGQAFFIEAQSSNDLKFNNSMRSKNYANTEFFRTSTGAPQKDRVWLNLQNTDGMFGQLLVAYFDETTLDFDWAYDGRVNLTNNYVSFYSIAGAEKYKIQARPTFDPSDVVPLGYFSGVSGQFTISIDAKEGALNVDSTPIYLEDKLLNITHNLKQSPYTFETTYGRFENRFLLRYTENALSNPNFENIESSVIVATNQGQLNINSYLETMEQVTVYDILGRQLSDTKNIANEVFTVSNLTASQQALIVKIKLTNGMTVTRKIIL